MTESIQVFTAANEAYAIPLCASITSMIRATSCKLDIIVFDGGISETSWSRIETSAKSVGKPHNVIRQAINLDSFSEFPLLRSSALTYARILIDGFTDRSKVLYIDSDTVVQSDLRMLIDIPLDGCIIGAAQDPVVRIIGNERIATTLPEVPGDTPYFNAGVLLIDMNLWRSFNVRQRCIDFLVNNSVAAQYWDQSALNYCLVGRWKMIPSSWNCGAYTVKDSQILVDASIIHYIGWFKPWLYGTHKGPAADRFYEALQGTQWNSWRPNWFKFQLKSFKYHFSRILKR